MSYMLDAAFHRSLYAAEAERLKTHIYLLLGAAEVESGQLWFPDQLTEPRFSQLGSGLYGWVGGEARKRNGQMICGALPSSTSRSVNASRTRRNS